MSAFLAIVADTWRQSRQQVVFIILIVLELVLLGTGVWFLEVDESGDEPVVAIRFVEEENIPLADIWVDQYARSLLVAEDHRVPAEFMQESNPDHKRALDQARERARHISTFRKGLEVYVSIVVAICITISMWLFLAACSSYFPHMMAEGAVDLIVSKPLSRAKIYFGKFLGGLLLYAVVLQGSLALIFLLLGVRFDCWLWGLFRVLPTQMLSVSLLYAIIALIGILFRSTVPAMVIGYFLYLVVDGVLSALIRVQQMGTLEQYSWIDSSVEWAGTILPCFDYVQEMAVKSLFSIPAISVVPITVAGIWLAVSLIVGLTLFQRRDF